MNFPSICQECVFQKLYKLGAVLGSLLLLKIPSFLTISCLYRSNLELYILKMTLADILNILHHLEYFSRLHKLATMARLHARHVYFHFLICLAYWSIFVAIHFLDIFVSKEMGVVATFFVFS